MLPGTEPALSRAQFEAVSPGRRLGLYCKLLGECGIDSRRKLLWPGGIPQSGESGPGLGAELTANAEGREWVIFCWAFLAVPELFRGPLPELGCPWSNWPRAFGGRVPIPVQLCPSRLGVAVVSLLQKGCGISVVGKGQSRDS